MRRPPVPAPAERARTIAARGGRCTLLRSRADTLRSTPLVHHVHADGAVTALLPDDHPLVAIAFQQARRELAALAEIADQAAVALREPVRGLLWVTGWLTVLDGDRARAQVLEVAEENPDPRLLDAGHGATVLHLTPATLVVADGEGATRVRQEEFLEAAPDPFHASEDEWLRHLECAHGDVVGVLSRHLPDRLRGGHLRPLGLDRLGLRLRVEAVDGDHDVRLAFSRPVGTAEELAGELRRLVGCPFLAAQHG